jgi:ketosteroid isomerase-like protein
MSPRRTLLAAAVLVLALPAAAPARAPATIEAAEAEWYAALMAASGPRLDALIADDFAYQHPTGTTYAKAAFIAEFTSGNVTVARIGAVERRLRDYGQTVIVSGSNPIEGMLAGRPYAGTMRFVNVWRNEGAGWRIVHRNSEILPPQ